MSAERTQPGAPTPSTPTQALMQLAAERPEFGLQWREAGSEAPSLDEVAAGRGGILDAWLSDTASLATGIDSKTAAAYLVSIFIWRLGEILATLYLRGVALPALTAKDIIVTEEVAGSAGSRDLRFCFRLRLGGAGRAFDREAFHVSLIGINAPLVSALSDRTGLSQRALWRLVTDGVAGGFLACGKLSGCVDLARQEAEAILAGRHSHLSNTQWSFIEIAPNGQPAEWFRLRGGCCRLYRTSGGDYCTTCVLRSIADQVERLKTYMRNRQ